MVYPISVTKEIGWLRLILLKETMAVYRKNIMRASHTHKLCGQSAENCNVETGGNVHIPGEDVRNATVRLRNISF
jgi:hypothetical protein